MSWLTEGPLGQFRENHPGLTRGAMVGGAPGAVVGAIYDWLQRRDDSYQGNIATNQSRQNDATQQQLWGALPDAGPTAPLQDAPQAAQDTSGGGPANEGGGGMAPDRSGMQQPGGGMGGGWNNASSNMLTDFSATTNGDYQQRTGLNPKNYKGSNGAKAR